MNPDRFRKLTDSLLNLLFPPKCPFCGKVIEEPGVCGGCAARLPWLGDADGLRTFPGGLVCAGVFRYEGAVREALLRMKFEGRAAYTEPLGRLVGRCAAEWFGGEFDTVTWAPVSAKRRRQRGFDQSELLAASACRTLGLRPARLLVKTRDNPPQSRLRSLEERRANTSGVYALRRGRNVKGRRVLLLDDICTTGETLRACREVLLAGGAASVVCAALAIAGRSDDTQDDIQGEL